MADTHLIAHNNDHVVYVEVIEECEPAECRDWFTERGYRVEVDDADVHVYETPESATWRKRHHTIIEVMSNAYGW